MRVRSNSLPGFRCSVEPKALVQLGNDAGPRESVSSSSGVVSLPCFVLTGASTPGFLSRAISVKKSSTLLKKQAREKIDFLQNWRDKLEHK